MEKRIGKISIAKIRQHNPDLLGVDNDMLIDNKRFSATDSMSSIFKYPLRVDGIIISLREYGEGTVNVNLRDYDVKKNDLVICAPDDLLQAHLKPGEHQMQLFIISSDFLNNIFINLNNLIPLFISLKDNPVFHLSDNEVAELKEFFYLINKAIHSEDTFRVDTIKHLMGSYLYKLGSILHRRDPNHITNNKPFKREEVLFNQFINLVTEFHCQERRVDFYAEKLFLSAKHFSTVIKRVSGKTAGEWIDAYVILEAKALLKYSSMSIQEVAYYLNFPNPSFFGKYFKRHVNMSPSEYKAK